MSFSVGIIGLPNVGKSTLFKTLTKNPVDISNYPFTTIEPNIGIVRVPDERLEKIAEIIKPEKIVPTIIEFVDIAGLVKEAHKGEGLGNQFLANIREVNAMLHIIRAFEDPNIAHVEKTIDPERDIEIISTELMMKDLEIVEKHIEKLSKDVKSGSKESIKKLEAAQKIKNALNNGNWAKSESESVSLLDGIQFLTAKPIIYLFNIKGGSLPEKYNELATKLDSAFLVIDIKTEEDMEGLSQEEIKELELQSKIDELIKICYKTLNLITFYTIKGGKETRAWTVPEGATAPEAGLKVHTDFGEKFIRAEIINWENLLKAGSWTNAREGGLIRTEGKEYIVKDGDIIEFKI